MRIAARNIRGQLIDLERNQPIRFARWADLETGEYEAFRADPREAKRQGINLRELLYRRQTRLTFKPASYPMPPGRAVAAYPSTARPFTLPLVVFDRPCQVKTCNRDAAWLVADELQLEPLVWNGRKFERAQTRQVRYFCDWHFQNPRLYDGKGELIGEQEVEARPQ